jgi:hypothetical protein
MHQQFAEEQAAASHQARVAAERCTLGMRFRIRVARRTFRCEWPATVGRAHQHSNARAFRTEYHTRSRAVRVRADDESPGKVGHVRPFNGHGHQSVAAPEACDNTKVVLRPITNLVRRKTLDVVMMFSG